jgi:hypothetical protein
MSNPSEVTIMPRVKGQGPSVSGWFRQHYRDNPGLLRIKSNETVFKAWSDAHGGRDPGQKEKQALANVKSTLKKQFGIGKRGRKKKVEANAEGAMVKPARPATSSSTLERLEYAIDRCLDMARNLDDPELAQVVKLLRLARNDVVLKNG